MSDTFGTAWVQFIRPTTRLSFQQIHARLQALGQQNGDTFEFALRTDQPLALQKMQSPWVRCKEALVIWLRQFGFHFKPLSELTAFVKPASPVATAQKEETGVEVETPKPQAMPTDSGEAAEAAAKQAVILPVTPAERVSEIAVETKPKKIPKSQTMPTDLIETAEAVAPQLVVPPVIPTERTPEIAIETKPEKVEIPSQAQMQTKLQSLLQQYCAPDAKSYKLMDINNEFMKTMASAVEYGYGTALCSVLDHAQLQKIITHEDEYSDATALLLISAIKKDDLQAFQALRKIGFKVKSSAVLLDAVYRYRAQQIKTIRAQIGDINTAKCKGYSVIGLLGHHQIYPEETRKAVWNELLDDLDLTNPNVRQTVEWGIVWDRVNAGDTGTIDRLQKLGIDTNNWSYGKDSISTACRNSDLAMIKTLCSKETIRCNPLEALGSLKGENAAVIYQYLSTRYPQFFTTVSQKGIDGHLSGTVANAAVRHTNLEGLKFWAEQQHFDLKTVSDIHHENPLNICAWNAEDVPLDITHYLMEKQVPFIPNIDRNNPIHQICQTMVKNSHPRNPENVLAHLTAFLKATNAKELMQQVNKVHQTPLQLLQSGIQKWQEEKRHYNQSLVEEAMQLMQAL